MRRISGLMIGALVMLAAVRAALVLGTCLLKLPSPLETYHLEAKMVHLAWRVQEGLVLYPDWREGPFVSNFYGPWYFALVGWLGGLVDGSLGGIFKVGRGLSLASALATALVVGLYARRWGRGAAWGAGLASLGSATLYGFAVMARPDVMADFLGLAGFLAAISDRRWLVWLGGVVLVLAILTKQTAVVYLVAAVMARLVCGLEGRGVGLLVGCGLGTIGLIAGLTWLVEPRMAVDLLGDAATPWTLNGWVVLIRRLLVAAPELVVLPILGVALWIKGERRDRGLVALAACLMLASLVTAAKVGADLNYFLGLRGVAALGLGVMVGQLGAGRTGRMAALGLVVLVSLLPGLAHDAAAFEGARGERAMLGSPMGRSYLAGYRGVWRAARADDPPILTDAGLVDIQQEERTAFGDPFLFRLQVMTGRIDPREMVERVERREYGVIFTRSELMSPGYDGYEFGLPPVVAAVARRRYVAAGRVADLFVYTPRPGDGGAP